MSKYYFHQNFQKLFKNRLVGHRQWSHKPFICDPRVLFTGMSRASPCDAGHITRWCSYGTPRICLCRVGSTARQTRLHVHTHWCRTHILWTWGKFLFLVCLYIVKTLYVSAKCGKVKEFLICLYEPL